MRNALRFSALAALTAVLLPASASAQSCESVAGNLVLNCSFENPDIKNGASYPYAPLNDWTANPVGVVERWKNSFGGFTAKDGNAHVELKVNQGTTLSQYLNTAAGMQYDLAFSAGHRVNGGNYSQIDVYFDNTFILSTGQMTTGYVWNDFATVFTSAGDGGWLEFRSMGSHPTYGDHLDNVSVAANGQPASVPEPASIALLAAGLAGLGVVGRRRSA
jgi:hypothetical protein